MSFSLSYKFDNDSRSFAPKNVIKKNATKMPILMAFPEKFLSFIEKEEALLKIYNKNQ